MCFRKCAVVVSRYLTLISKISLDNVLSCLFTFMSILRYNIKLEETRSFLYSGVCAHWNHSKSSNNSAWVAPTRDSDLIGLGCHLANGILKFSRLLNVQPKLRASLYIEHLKKIKNSLVLKHSRLTWKLQREYIKSLYIIHSPSFNVNILYNQVIIETKKINIDTIVLTNLQTLLKFHHLSH